MEKYSDELLPQIAQEYEIHISKSAKPKDNISRNVSAIPFRSIALG
jgi:hypothetical protein